jgi:ABC-type multidrug transport system ATPase subunit
MADRMILTEGLVKRYGRHPALQGLDLTVQPGEVFGHLGPNGAGKTSTIRLLLDLLRPTAGTVRVLGQDPRAGGARLRRRIGLVGNDSGLFQLTAAQHSQRIARLVICSCEAFDNFPRVRRVAPSRWPAGCRGGWPSDPSP